jgi:DNA-binding CsgD family transcriptional regulator
MDQINAIMRTQLSEREVIIFLIVQSGKFANYRELGDVLGVSHETVRKIYTSAKEKIEKAGAAGYFQTTVDKPQKKH